MKEKIRNIVQLQTGMYAKPQPNAEVYYIQARHFDRNREFILSVNPDLAFDKKIEKHFLQVGDVLVASKGYDHFAVTYKGIVRPAVASSMFMVLRMKDQKKILPEYLAWFINHPTTQTLLSENSKGTSIPSLNKIDIGDLELTIPSVKHQQSILKIQALRQREVKIQQQINQLREQYIQQSILNTLNK
ncbi:restriction endonuclease subunit S [Pedobacter sp. V48]|uniref:restriction endonuclease subunit S n=1 Tax=Pedobacter sp. V48 TaxID=509635 RepID=UPI0003E44FDB|nr:restriction endonuclease subunit S [Pedobacter sp. V48]ETZ22189.1 hypothetical protein N824_25005 [Pedobacter sp. V48]